MLTFLSDEWIDALDAAGAAGARDTAADDRRDPVLTIEQRIRVPGADVAVTYAVVVYEDGIRVRKGAAASADVTFVVDRDTAARIAQGTLSAQAAFMSGDLELIGEASALLSSQTTLSDLSDRFAAVRDQTQW